MDNQLMALGLTEHDGKVVVSSRDIARVFEKKHDNVIRDIRNIITFGRHTHRIVAEQKLGRPLNADEVVHHLDGDKRNNSPDNIRVFPSQKEHAEFHAKLYAFFMGGGDAQ